MIEFIGCIITINTIIICFTYCSCRYKHIDYLDDCLREEKRQFDITEANKIEKEYE